VSLTTRTPPGHQCGGVRPRSSHGPARSILGRGAVPALLAACWLPCSRPACDADPDRSWPAPAPSRTRPSRALPPISLTGLAAVPAGPRRGLRAGCGKERALTGPPLDIVARYRRSRCAATGGPGHAVPVTPPGRMHINQISAVTGHDRATSSGMPNRGSARRDTAGDHGARRHLVGLAGPPQVPAGS
jgi:hypothetical protein